MVHGMTTTTAIRAARPTPLPSELTTAGSPETWHKSPLVRVEFESPRLANQTGWAFPAWRHGRAYIPVTDEHIPSSAAQRNDTPDFAFGAVGTDFATAIRTAHSITMGGTAYRGLANWPATAVLQANDGVYYVAPLGFFSGADRQVVSIDGPYLPGEVANVERLHEDVKAVVGGRSWVNYSDDDVTVDLRPA